MSNEKNHKIKYSEGMDPPDYIAPPEDPLEASKKVKKLIEELPEKWEQTPEKPCFKKRPYRRRVFSSKIRRKIMQQFRIGRVTEPQKDVAMSKTYRTDIMDKLCDKCDCEFCDIVKWLKENWNPVLQILLSEFKIHTPQEGYRYPAGGDPFDNDHYREDRDAS